MNFLQTNLKMSEKGAIKIPERQLLSMPLDSVGICTSRVFNKF